MTQRYYSDYERNRHGPVGAADLAALHADGQLDPATLVWREGMAQWQPWHTVMAEVVPETAHPAAARASFATASADAPAGASRSAARRVGKECVSTSRSRWWTYP